MALTIRAHFDGAVIIPDEPVDLPVGESLEIELRPVRTEDQDGFQRRGDALERLFERPIFGVVIPNEALSRESIYAEDT